MNRTIVILLCLALFLCGCGIAVEDKTSETTSVDITKEYEFAVYRELGVSFPRPSIIVSEKDGKYNLIVNVTDFRDVDHFPEYVFRVKDAFEKTIPIDCAAGYSLYFVDPNSKNHVHFSSLDYTEDPNGITGFFKDSRKSESPIYKIERQEDWAILFPESYSEITEPEMVTYILNTNTMKFHCEWCNSAKETKESNKTTFTGTRDDVISNGYTPCQICNP